ncbi:alpha/beta fold hydrolase [Rhodococcus sp. X156]|uniref:alpha/beta fold hydrolase n=1 Tax=Rhodococcus sp. X156 TaxID=2499145 RepID=UPI000FD9A755|nr:alpha/beta fold hydrolase [Rhodococcus sp. X156]
MRNAAPATVVAPTALSTDVHAELGAVDLTRTEWPGEMVDVGGRAVHVRTTPGPEGAVPAVYVHGLGGSATNWTDLAGALAPLMPGYALDLPGFGRSEPPADGDYSLPGCADLVIDYLEQQPAPVHLFGNSMGGAIAILVAARRPDLVQTLTLVSPAVPDLRPDPRRVSDLRMVLAVVPIIGRLVRQQLAETPAERRAEQMIRLCFADPDAVPENKIAAAVQEADERKGQSWASSALNKSFNAILQTWVTLPHRSLWSVAGKVQAPTLVVWGTKDRLVTVERAPKLVAVIRRSRLLVFNQVGHVAQMERPVAVARAVRGMLQEVQEGQW